MSIIRKADLSPADQGWVLRFGVGMITVLIGLGLGYLVTHLRADVSLVVVGGAGIAAFSFILVRPQLGFVLLAIGASFVTSVELPVGNMGPGEVVVVGLLVAALMGVATRTYRPMPLAV